MATEWPTKHATLRAARTESSACGYYWIHVDRQGSIESITTSTGAIALRRTYRPYGDKIADTGTHAESRGWTDQRQDASGLTYLHARYYDPIIGGFLSPDPILASLANYDYGFGDPINSTDRTGLGPETPVFDVTGTCNPYTGEVSACPPGFLAYLETYESHNMSVFAKEVSGYEREFAQMHLARLIARWERFAAAQAARQDRATGTDPQAPPPVPPKAPPCPPPGCAPPTNPDRNKDGRLDAKETDIGLAHVLTVHQQERDGTDQVINPDYEVYVFRETVAIELVAVAGGEAFLPNLLRELGFPLIPGKLAATVGAADLIWRNQAPPLMLRNCAVCHQWRYEILSLVMSREMSSDGDIAIVASLVGSAVAFGFLEWHDIPFKLPIAAAVGIGCRYTVKWILDRSIRDW
jgi:RHS repeat-associated protein